MSERVAQGATHSEGRSAARDLVITEVRLGLAGPWADVLIASGRVAAIEAPGALAVPRGLAVLPGAGGTLLPGLVDAHVHVTQWALARRRVDVSSAISPEHAAQLVATAVAGGATGAPGSDGADLVVAYGFRDSGWTQELGLDILDRVLPGRAVGLISADLHTVWLSRAAAARLAVDPGADGVLREAAALEAAAALSEADVATTDRWALEALSAAAARGVTGVVDFEAADNLAVWGRRARAGRLPTRVSAAIYPEWLAGVSERGLAGGDVLPGTHGLVTVGPFKVFVDGSLNTRTAFCHHAYPQARPGEEHGVLTTAPDRLTSLVSAALLARLTPAVHAIGDRANTIALDVFEQLGCPGRIEHAQQVRREDLHRFADLGVVAGIQPVHALDDRDVVEREWAGQVGQAFPHGDLVRAGARIEIGSDAPVSPLDPWLGMSAAVARERHDGRGPWHREQAIPLEVALAAAAGGRSGVRVGDRADLVIVAADPSHLDPRDLPDVTIRATLVAGVVAHHE